jgi:uncharacterized protein
VDSARLDHVAHRHGIQLLLQYGSTIAGRTHARSDIDLGVVLAHVPSMDEYGALVTDLQQLFPGHDVDLAILNHADPLFLKKVLERCSLLYGSVSQLQQLKLYAFKRYQDHRRFLAMEREYVRRRRTAPPA